MDEAALQAHAAELLRSRSYDTAFNISPIEGGGNNRVFRIDSPNWTLLIKAYFRHEDDPRDRLNSEFSFCRFAWRHGIRCIPEPVAADHAHQLGLYEFIRGRRLTQTDITPDAVDAAADFFAEVNRHRGAPDAEDLPVASEACFSIEAHLDCVARRVRRLATIPQDSPQEREAAAFVRDHLRPAWQRVKASVREHTDAQTLKTELPASARCISPSDFGFHNALVEADGRLRFLDFEYAGWDDPAKMVCDFFCQVSLPAPMTMLDTFMEKTLQGIGADDSAHDRVRALLPVYQIKWCCIVLNDFLPIDSARRQFAQKESDPRMRKEKQLLKAANLLNGLLTPGGTTT